jgi:cell wall-associated NlpC family hydrolase
MLLMLLAGCASTPSRPERVSDERMNDLVIYALSLADTPYRFGGSNTNSGFDCSGYVGHVYRHQLNITLPRTSREISRIGEPLDQSELTLGDLLFYNTQHTPFSHVGIYIGEGKFVHAPKSGDRIRIERMNLPYWKNRYNGARRVR